MKTKWNGCLRSLSLLGACAGLALVAGCATGVKNPSGTPVTEMRPDEKGFVAGTGVESTDLVRVTDKMARGILGCAQIAHAPAAPWIVLDPVVNETRFPINKNIFLDRIRGQLISKAQGKARFVARERLAVLERERQMKQAGQLTSTSDPTKVEFKGADFFLSGKLSGMSSSASGGISDYILYSFQLIDARTSEIVWEGSDEIKKQGVADAVYR
ncbi:MAG: penicillin-binding protein activator LpoB [Verrucomicrobia bacterium]|nr:penicillin-binding protein activator LpoB [Verrucomicrobiota bacterium]